MVISPLIALMKDQVYNLNQKGIKATAIYSGLPNKIIDTLLDNCVYGKIKFLYISPERLASEDFRVRMGKMKISLLAVDEAHCISEWGHDFRPEYRRLRPIIEQIADCPIMALTATATPKVQQDIQKNLGMLNAKLFKASFNRANLYYEIRPKNNIGKQIIQYIKANSGKSGIIYTLNRKTTEELASMLEANGISAVAYHAGIDGKIRAERQDMFLNEDVQVIVATIAFGMGIDKPDIRFVIHFNIPKSIENYYQETGRAGRDGMEGICVLYYSHKDVSKLEHLMRDKPLSEREVGGQLIDETVAFAESGVCRRRILMSYFGEDYGQENCNSCDNCLHPKEKLEARAQVAAVLKSVKALDERFPTEYVVQVLTGKMTPQMKMYRHDALDVFASGNEQTDYFWRSLIRQVLLEGLLEKDIEEYGILKLTRKGAAFLKKPTSFMMVLNDQYEDANEDDDEGSAPVAEASADPRLFDMLKELRKDVSKEKKLPPFVIFLESSLEDMATQYPTSIGELEKISGVSKGKALRYGKPFLDLIARYVEENDIVRPDDFVMKTVANKSSNKVFIIQQVDKRMPLDTIAKNKDMRMDQLLEEMETIVASGTKLNLNYAIDQMVDEDDQLDILDYFKNCETSSLQIAQEELGDLELDWEQLKIMRIKFLSEFGM